jgi:hypothetical protein
MEENTSRRNFIQKAVLAGGAVAGASQNAHGKTKQKPKIPTTDLLRIGTIALGVGSHMNYEIWPQFFNPTMHPYWPVGRTTRMTLTHCWDKIPEVSEAFAKKYNCEAVKNYYDMVGKVDGIIFAGFNECKWWPQLTKPYLEAGIPCVINRPFAYSMKDAKTIIETAKKNNTPILNVDEREYLQQTTVGRYKVEDLLRAKNNIIGVHSTNAAGEWSQHGVHGLYFLLGILGLDVETAGYQADGWWSEITPTSKSIQHFGQLTLQYRGIKVEGVGEQKEPFLVSQFQNWPKADNVLRIYHNSGWWDTDHPSTSENIYTREYFFFFPTVLAMQEMFETRKMYRSYEYILKRTQIFLTAFKSHLEHNGALIRVDDLPEDWEAPSPYPDWIDESIF